MLAEAMLDLLHLSPEYGSLLEGLKKGYREQMVYGLSNSMKSFLAAGLRRETGRPLLLITSTIQQAERMCDDLMTWLPQQSSLLFPPMEHLPFAIMAHSPEVAGQRLSVLEALVRGENQVVVAPAAALLRLLTPPDIFRQSMLPVKVGLQFDLEQATAQLVRSGYERREMVEGRGQLARRGDIIDVWSLSWPAPLRIESEWERVTRIRQFDVASQRSTGEVSEVLIGPAREFVLPPNTSAAADQIRSELDNAIRRLGAKNGHSPLPPLGDSRLSTLFFGGEQPADKLRDRVLGHLDLLAADTWFEGIEQYLSYFFPVGATLLDYFAQTPLVLVDEPARLREAAQEIELHNQERQVAYLESGGLLPGQTALNLGFIDFLGRLHRRQSVHFSLLLKKVQGLEPQHMISITAKSMQEFHGQWALVQEEVNRWREQRYRILIVAATPERQERLRQTMAEADMFPAMLAPEIGIDGLPALAAIPPGQIGLATGSLEGGFQWPGLRLCVATDGEIFGRAKKKRRLLPAGDSREAARLASLQDLKVNDYVVHVNHGIGKYLGVQTEQILGATRDYAVIQYEGTDRLKIPTDQIGQIQKYVGAEGQLPRLNKLGGAEWAKVKARVKESIREMAAELLRLQATRAALPGHAFSDDTPWQAEFEDAFPFEETPDQLRAAAEIKADMGLSRPMDRLLLGDVGYGKTEVALRAAFKAAVDGKQVAILVPTTILAEQHYATCRQRFEGFPLTVAALNRFRTQREQQQILDRLTRGEIDVIIGTHRLLGEDVRFKDLGLVIVDEEQRFGVQHKERLKLLRATVDVLTLSATPIPRTLHMSMVGVRDVSAITTPPEDRFPVETYVAEYDDELVRDAIQRELYRGGQVYYVCNRVQAIENVAARIQRLVPDARIGIGHGQMKEEQLERVMLDFIDGEYDVLVATTIIENGLDIARVNTLLAEEADHLGLSQLYQLRGRVGRSNRLAYAYFLYRRDKVLTEQAEKRLSAIKDFTELGSGFKIAMRDLEIRGAGNILGPEQHGFIISVGFDLYCQLLDECVRELKGEAEPPPLVQPVIELAIDAYIPDTYVMDPRQKIEAYKRVTTIRSEADCRDVAAEWADRYGILPVPVENLLTIARLRLGAAAAGVSSINQVRERVHFKFVGNQPPESGLILRLGRKYRGRVTAGNRPPAVILRTHEWAPADVLSAVEDVISSMQAVAMVNA